MTIYNYRPTTYNYLQVTMSGSAADSDPGQQRPLLAHRKMRRLEERGVALFHSKVSQYKLWCTVDSLKLVMYEY